MAKFPANSLRIAKFTLTGKFKNTYQEKTGTSVFSCDQKRVEKIWPIFPSIAEPLRPQPPRKQTKQNKTKQKEGSKPLPPKKNKTKTKQKQTKKNKTKQKNRTKEQKTQMKFVQDIQGYSGDLVSWRMTFANI